MLHWYALNTKPNAEYQVVELLARHRVETFLPTLKATRPRRGHNSVPLFPGYLFVHVDFDVMGYSTIAWMPGLRGIVGVERQAAIVDDEIVVVLRSRVDELWKQGGLPTHSFKPGDRVRINSGPLEGLMGVFDSPLTPSERVRILLNFLGRSRPTMVMVSDLAPASVHDVDPLDAIETEQARAEARRRRTRGKGRKIHYQHELDSQKDALQKSS